MKKPIRINIARDFSRFPGGRFIADGPHTGQRFREDHLKPALLKEQEVIIELDGTLGYGSSFLEEAFGGLVREKTLTESNKHLLKLQTQDLSLKIEIEQYIDEAIASQMNHP